MSKDAVDVPLSQGLVAIIDACEFESVHEVALSSCGVVWRGRICDRNWTASVKPHTNYAQSILASRFQLRLHRLILNCTYGEIVDHKNGNGLDNRLSNIRKCNPRENARNMRISEGDLRGVGRRDNGKWVAWIRYTPNGASKSIKVHLGTFPSRREACHARNVAAEMYHGEFAVLNT